MRHHVLFICVRNRVRSVFAEFYLKKKLAEKIGALAEEIKISSAGYYPKTLKKILDQAGVPTPDPFFDTDMSAIVRRLMHEKCIAAPDQWRSKPLDTDLVIAADLIFTALPWQKEEIAAAYPEFSGNIFTLREMAEWDHHILSETLEGLPLNESFWLACEENPSYVTKVIEEVEDLLDLGLPFMLKQLGIG